MLENETLLKSELLLDTSFSVEHQAEFAPKWHGEVLKKRMVCKSEYVDWKKARKNL
jgi:hypothetical protein